MSPPLADLDAQYRRLRDALLPAITRVSDELTDPPAAVVSSVAASVRRHVGAAP